MTARNTAEPGLELLGQIADLLREVAGEDEQWLARIEPGSRLDGDLLVDSVELAAFSLELERRYGGAVDLAGYVAGLDIDRIIALSVADVAHYVASHRDQAAAAVGSGDR
jgi:acyl carrier protein